MFLDRLLQTGLGLMIDFNVFFSSHPARNATHNPVS